MNKIISENLFEFKKGMDPVDSLGLGRRKMIKDWLDSMNIRNYIINNDYTIDVRSGDVDLVSKGLREFPEFIQFNYVYGSFKCYKNELISLKGSPVIVDGYFDCSNNNLISLDGAPKNVGRYFSCRFNNIEFTEDEVRQVCNVIGRVYVLSH